MERDSGVFEFQDGLVGIGGERLSQQIEEPFHLLAEASSVIPILPYHSIGNENN